MITGVYAYYLSMARVGLFIVEILVLHDPFLLSTLAVLVCKKSIRGACKLRLVVRTVVKRAGAEAMVLAPLTPYIDSRALGETPSGALAYTQYVFS